MGLFGRKTRIRALFSSRALGMFELALTVVALLVIVVGIVEFGRITWVRSRMNGVLQKIIRQAQGDDRLYGNLWGSSYPVNGDIAPGTTYESLVTWQLFTQARAALNESFVSLAGAASPGGSILQYNSITYNEGGGADRGPVSLAFLPPGFSARIDSDPVQYVSNFGSCQAGTSNGCVANNNANLISRMAAAPGSAAVGRNFSLRDAASVIPAQLVVSYRMRTILGERDFSVTGVAGFPRIQYAPAPTSTPTPTPTATSTATRTPTATPTAVAR